MNELIFIFNYETTSLICQESCRVRAAGGGLENLRYTTFRDKVNPKRVQPIFREIVSIKRIVDIKIERNCINSVRSVKAHSVGFLLATNLKPPRYMGGFSSFLYDFETES